MSSISIKKSAVAGKIPVAADLEVGELAANFPDQKLYTKDVSGNILELGANGIQQHDPTRTYSQYEIATLNGCIYRNTGNNTTGPFDATIWEHVSGVTLWDSTIPHVRDELIVKQGVIYVATKNVAAGPWNAADWKRIAPSNAIVPDPAAGVSQAITAADPADIPLTLQGATGQTANLQEWKDAAGDTRSFVREDKIVSGKNVPTSWQAATSV